MKIEQRSGGLPVVLFHIFQATHVWYLVPLVFAGLSSGSFGWLERELPVSELRRVHMKWKNYRDFVQTCPRGSSGSPQVVQPEVYGHLWILCWCFSSLSVKQSDSKVGVVLWVRGAFAPVVLARGVFADIFLDFPVVASSRRFPCPT